MDPSMFRSPLHAGNLEQPQTSDPAREPCRAVRRVIVALHSGHRIGSLIWYRTLLLRFCANSGVIYDRTIPSSGPRRGRSEARRRISSKDPLLEPIVDLQLLPADRIMRCDRPVSYTHLDVYKRQGLPSAAVRTALACVLDRY